MSKIKIFAEFYGGRRRPVVDLWLNGQSLIYKVEYVERVGSDQENIILSADGDLKDQNIFQVIMKDKTDDDLIITDQKVIDHYIVIKEAEVDGIRFEEVLHKCCRFEHSMDQEWVSHMKSRGYDIQPVYENSLHIRLNGAWSMEFESPVWRWHTKKIAWEFRHESLY